MSIPTVPTISEIFNRIIADIEGKIGQDAPWLPKAFIRVLAGSLSGLFVLLYGAIMWVYKQIFPQTADYAALILLGAIVGITPKPETKALILCDVPGTGSNVPSGTVFSGPNGLMYKVTTTTAMSGGVASDVPMRCLTGGEIGNLADGAELNITKTVIGIDGTATVASTSEAGADMETKENFRKRVIARYRRRATGASPFDYWLWGMECPNFIWIGPYNDETIPNKIHVYGKVDNQTNGIPTTAQLNQLASYLKDDPETGKADRATMSHRGALECHAITVHTFDVEITIKDADEDTKDAIEAAVRAFFESFEPYIEGVSDDKRNTLATGNVSEVAQAEAGLDGAVIIDVAITDTETTDPIFENRYTFQGGEFGQVADLTFIDVT